MSLSTKFTIWFPEFLLYLVQLSFKAIRSRSPQIHYGNNNLNKQDRSQSAIVATRDDARIFLSASFDQSPNIASQIDVSILGFDFGLLLHEHLYLGAIQPASVAILSTKASAPPLVSVCSSDVFCRPSRRRAQREGERNDWPRARYMHCIGAPKQRSSLGPAQGFR